MPIKYSAMIHSVSSYLPPRVVKNEEFTQWMETTDEWIQERSGIKERRFADESVSTSDLAILAAKELFLKNSIPPEDIDAIIAATISPDFYFPGIGPLLQHKLGLRMVPAFDIRAQCGAFLYGTQLAQSLIESGTYKNILLVCSDLQSKFMDFSTKGRNMSVLFADGAACVLFKAHPVKEKPSTQNNERGVIDTILGCDGGGAELLLFRSPGTGTPQFLPQEAVDNKDIHPYMDGRSVFKHAINRMSEVCEALLKRNGISASDLAMCFPHQANLRISESVRERLGLPVEKVFNNIQKYGNTTSATIPICLKEAMDLKKVKEGDLVLTVAFGSGFIWGASLIRL